MDELSSWCEVIRSLMPQRYEVRILWGRGVITVSVPQTGRSVVLSASSLAGRTPSDVVDSLRSELRVGRPAYVRVA